MNVFRKKSFVKSPNLGGADACFSKQIRKEVVTKNGVNVSYVRVANVDMPKENLIMPCPAEFDLEQQLKAGVKPEQINVHGLLDDYSFNVNDAVNKLTDIVEKSQSVAEVNEPVEPVKENVES